MKDEYPFSDIRTLADFLIGEKVAKRRADGSVALFSDGRDYVLCHIAVVVTALLRGESDSDTHARWVSNDGPPKGEK